MFLKTKMSDDTYTEENINVTIGTDRTCCILYVIKSFFFSLYSKLKSITLKEKIIKEKEKMNRL